jgi:hypothetical protein
MAGCGRPERSAAKAVQDRSGVRAVEAYFVMER